MFNKYIYIVQPKEQKVGHERTVQNPYYCSESKYTIFTFKLLNNGEESIDSIYMLMGKNIPQKNIYSINLLEEDKPLEFKIVEGIEYSGTDDFNHLEVKLDESVNSNKEILIQIKLLGQYIEADLSGIKSIFSLSIKGQKRSFHGDKFFVPILYKEEGLSIYKECWKGMSDDGSVILNYKINITNCTCRCISRLKFSEKLYYCSGVKIDKILINLKGVEPKTKDGIVSFKKVFENIKCGQNIIIYYRVFLDQITMAGAYNFPAISELSYRNTHKERSCNLKLKWGVFTLDASCNIINSNDAQFLINIKSSEFSPSADILVKNNIMIPKGITIKFMNLQKCDLCTPIDYSCKEGEYFTDTIVELNIKRRVAKNSEITVPINFTIIEIEGDRTSDYIRSTVEDVKVIGKKDYGSDICFINRRAYLRVKNDLTCLKMD